MAPRVCPRRGCRCVITAVAAATLLLQTFHVVQVFFILSEHVIPGPTEVQDNIHIPAVFRNIPEATRYSNTSQRSGTRQNNSEDRPGREAAQFRITVTRDDSRGINKSSHENPHHSLNVRKFPATSTMATRNISNIFQPQRPSLVRRLSLVSDVCHSHGSQIVGHMEKVYVYEAQKVAYCSTHKIASTYWIRIYRWLYNDTKSGHVASPLLISKLDTHLLPLKKLKVRNLTKHRQEDRTLVETSYRFLFTRDPYARLWSVYIDKFVLPDNYFWSYYAPKIKASVYGNGIQDPALTTTSEHQIQTSSADGNIEDNRDRHSNHLNRTQIQNKQNFGFVDGRRENSSHEVNKPHLSDVDEPHHRSARSGEVRSAGRFCPEVTFYEFLQYIVNVASSRTGQALDDHFRPVHYGCNPCHFRPHFIGHIETMKDDSAEVLRQMKLEKILHELNAEHVHQEIDMLINFNFDLVVAKGLQRACVTDADLERRLVQTFVYNGYIPAESQIWLEKQLPLGKVNLKTAVLSLYHSSGKTSDALKRQRERFKLEAFRQIPKDLLFAIQKVFYWDFKLFGYEPFPSEIFGRSE